MAVCYENGNLFVYNIKDNGGLEFFSIDKNEFAQCASWSPKGKQIVIAFPNGKLAQYKPDLHLARTIPCAVNLFSMQFDVLAVQWLSTYQFAAVFLPRDSNACPALHIVNAPKNLAPSYINYDDICYGQSGPRKHQIYLQHILQWNLLIVATSNSIEIGMLGTTETGETPKWQQYTMLDECRAELPLSADTKQEAYPVGLSLETGCTHLLMIGETRLSIPMPMIHLITTTGYLVSFNLLNMRPNIESICSPPLNVNDLSGLNQFKALPMMENPPQQHQPATMKATPPEYQIASGGGGDVGVFDLSLSSDVVGGGVTSTPTAAADSKPKSFSSASSDPSTKVVSNLFGQQSAPAIGGIGSGLPFGAMPTATISSFGNFSTLGGVNVTTKSNEPQLAFGSTQKSLLAASTPPTPSFSFAATQQPPKPPQVMSSSSNVSKSIADPPPKPFVTVNPVYTAPKDLNPSM